ncbi:TPA: restriction endonuclease subunit S [Photobacterium damselae]
MSELPSNWKEVKWNDITGIDGFRRGPFGGNLKKSCFVDEGFAVYEQYAPINNDCNSFRYFITADKFEELSGFQVQGGDFLISCSGTMGKITCVPEQAPKGVINQALLRIRLQDKFIDSDYFLRLFKSPQVQSLVLNKSGGGAIQNLAAVKELKEIPLPIAPLAEQKRIVEKLDEVLAQVDIIKARLDGIPALLKRFRQSVLASAVSGKLTDCEVPRQITCLKNLGKISGGKTPSKANSAFWNGDILWVSPKDMKSDYIEDSLDHISDLAMSQGGMKYVPKNSLLMVTRSGILAHTFPVALTTKKITINQDIKAFTPDCSLLLPQFGLYLIKGLAPRILAECSKTGTTVASVETKLLESMEFELPSTQEQKEIVRLVDQYFAFADIIEAQVKKAQARVDNLTQSILAKAFRGELVAQDPNDEPADKLLERIAQARKEAEALAKAAKKAGATKKKAAKSA